MWWGAFADTIPLTAQQMPHTQAPTHVFSSPELPRPRNQAVSNNSGCHRASLLAVFVGSVPRVVPTMCFRKPSGITKCLFLQRYLTTSGAAASSQTSSPSSIKTRCKVSWQSLPQASMSLCSTPQFSLTSRPTATPKANGYDLSKHQQQHAQS